MKKQLSLYTLLISLLFFSACTEDDINQDCFTCETTATEYCINESDNFYTITVDGTSTEVLLANELWADIRVQLLEECENPTETVCFNCNDTGIEYCYNLGDDFYTVEITDQDIQEIPLNDNSWALILSSAREICTDSIVDCYTCESEEITYCYTEGDDFYTVGNMTDDCDGDDIPDYLDPDTCDTEEQVLLEDRTWEEIKTQLESDCPIIEQDCYTCVSENTEYCYIEGNDFYTATVNNVDTQIDLNGQTWEEIKVQLESDCPPSASIVGNWEITNYQFIIEITTTVDSNDIETSSTGHGTDYNSFIEYTENPNLFDRTGVTIVEVTNTDENGVETIIDDAELEPFSGTWELIGDQLTTVTNGETELSTVLELSDTILRLRFNQTINDLDADNNPRVSIFEGFMTLNRQ